jgi:hypothetical protein
MTRVCSSRVDLSGHYEVGNFFYYGPITNHVYVHVLAVLFLITVTFFVRLFAK